MPAHRDLLLHDAEAVEPAEQEACTVHAKVEVYIITRKPARSQRRSGSDWAHFPGPQILIRGPQMDLLLGGDTPSSPPFRVNWGRGVF